MVMRVIQGCELVDKDKFVIKVENEDGYGLEVGSNVFFKITHKGSVYGRSKLCLFGVNTMFVKEET